MKYLKRYADEDAWHEVSYEEALETVLGNYKDNEEVRSWLTKENEIRCLFSDIRVEEDVKKIDWKELKDGNKVRCKNDGMVLEVKTYRGKKYLTGEHDMWPVNEFDPKEWEMAID